MSFFHFQKIFPSQQVSVLSLLRNQLKPLFQETQQQQHPTFPAAMKHIANQSATLSNKLYKISSIGKMNSVRISKIEATLGGTSPAELDPKSGFNRGLTPRYLALIIVFTNLFSIKIQPTLTKKTNNLFPQIPYIWIYTPRAISSSNTNSLVFSNVRKISSCSYTFFLQRGHS